jgi:hypothetical protein
VVLSVVAHAVIDAVAVPERLTSDCANPDTASVNVIVTENAPFCTPEGTEILTPGATVSGGSGIVISILSRFVSELKICAFVKLLPASRSV